MKIEGRKEGKKEGRKKHNMDKGTEIEMRKVGKGLQNENQRVYVGVKWITSWDVCRDPSWAGLW